MKTKVRLIAQEVFISFDGVHAVALFTSFVLLILRFFLSQIFVL
jgi:hypothetical protein